MYATVNSYFGKGAMTLQLINTGQTGRRANENATTSVTFLWV